MPVRYWRHQCKGQGEHLVAGPVPCACGRANLYDGWGNTRAEAMDWYRRLHGLEPIGPHAAMAEELLRGAFVACKGCRAKGYLDTLDAQGYEPCPHCLGAGYVRVIGMEQLRALRQRVIDKHPEAAAAMDAPATRRAPAARCATPAPRAFSRAAPSRGAARSNPRVHTARDPCRSPSA